MLSHVTCFALLGLAHASKKPNTAIVHQFSNPTWLENIALYPSQNSVLATELNPEPNLWSVPLDGKSDPILVHSFEPELSLLGVAASLTCETDYYVIVGNYSFTTGSQAGSYGVYHVDLAKGPSKAKVNNVVVMEKASLLNGLAVVPQTNKLLLTDSNLGYIWQLDPETRKYEIFLDAPELKPGEELGANGLKIYRQRGKTWVYFSSSGQGLFCRVLFNKDATKVEGDVEVLYNGTFFDDFSVDKHGNAYLATGTGNVVDYLKQKGKKWELSTIAGSVDNNILAGSTSVALDEDKNALYVSTNGGFQAPVGGQLIGGHVVKVEL